MSLPAVMVKPSITLLAVILFIRHAIHPDNVLGMFAISHAVPISPLRMVGLLDPITWLRSVSVPAKPP